MRPYYLINIGLKNNTRWENGNIIEYSMPMMCLCLFKQHKHFSSLAAFNRKHQDKVSFGFFFLSAFGFLFVGWDCREEREREEGIMVCNTYTSIQKRECCIYNCSTNYAMVFYSIFLVKVTFYVFPFRCLAGTNNFYAKGIRCDRF